MSGGYFDYQQYRMHDIAEEIQHIIESNNSGEEPVYSFPPEIIARFKEAVKTLKRAEVMAQRIDWLLCGDDGEETFLCRWDEELTELQKEIDAIPVV